MSDQSEPLVPPSMQTVGEHRSHPMITDSHNPRLARQLARMVGLFGARGWGEITVVMDDGTTQKLPVTPETNERIQYVRKLLREYNLEPIE